MVNQYNALLTHFKDQDSKQTLQGSLSVCIARLAANTILPKLFLKMDVEYPNVVLYTQEAAIETILYSLIHGQLDFGIFGFLEYPSSQYGGLSQLKELLHSLQIIKLYVDQLVCIMSKNNPLSLQAGIDSQQLAQLRQTAYNYSFDYVPEGSILHVSNHTEIHKKFMLEENTVCCLPYRSFQTLYGEKDFVCLPIVDAEPITTYLAYHDIQNASEGKLYQAFIQTILDLVQI
jgi:DNA-binding transcriptional LysR family regulator